jgi:hypothetical protein
MITKSEFVAAALDRMGGGRVVRWVCVAEIIDDTGERLLHTLFQPGQASWETAGLLSQASVQTARTMG